MNDKFLVFFKKKSSCRITGDFCNLVLQILTLIVNLVLSSLKPGDLSFIRYRKIQMSSAAALLPRFAFSICGLSRQARLNRMRPSRAEIIDENLHY